MKILHISDNLYAKARRLQRNVERLDRMYDSVDDYDRKTRIIEMQRTIRKRMGIILGVLIDV